MTMGNAHGGGALHLAPAASRSSAAPDRAGGSADTPAAEKSFRGGAKGRFFARKAMHWGGAGVGKVKMGLEKIHGTRNDAARRNDGGGEAGAGSSATTAGLSVTTLLGSVVVSRRGGNRASGASEGVGVDGRGKQDLAAAAASASAAARRSALLRRRSSAERAALLAGLTARRSAIRRVSPGHEALLPPARLLKGAAATDLTLTGDEEEEEELGGGERRCGSDVVAGGEPPEIDVGGKAARRRSSLLRLRRRRSGRSGRAPSPSPSPPFAVSLQSCKPRPIPEERRPECLGTIDYRHRGGGRGALRAARAEALRSGRPLLVVSFRRHACCGDFPPGPRRGRDDAEELEPKNKNERREEPLSHPLLVEAAETLFVPALREVKDDESEDDDEEDDFDRETTNSCCDAGGGATLLLADARSTPTRDPAAPPPLPRCSWTVGAIAAAMARALRVSGHGVPAYLDLLVESEGGSRRGFGSGSGFDAAALPPSPGPWPRPPRGEAYLGTSDARRAEAELAVLDGVLATRAGWIGRQRAVRVSYDPSRLPFGALVRLALALDVADEAVYVRTGEEGIAARMELNRDRRRAAAGASGGAGGCLPRAPMTPPHLRPCFSFVRAYPGEEEASSRGGGPPPFHPADAPERKASLRSTPLSRVPLTELQSARANLLTRRGRFDEAVRLLSPRQGLIFMAALKTRQASVGGGGGPRNDGVGGRSGGGGGVLPLDLTDVSLTEAWRRLADSGFFDE